MSQYTLVDEVIEDLEDISDTLSEMGTSLGEADFEGSVATLDACWEKLKAIREYLAERDQGTAGDDEVIDD